MRREFTLLALVAVLGSPGPSAAHEEGVIHLATRTATVGQTLEMRGEKFTPNIRLRLELRGPLAMFPLGQVGTDAAGGFRVAPTLPAEARPGLYAIVALAPDGDEIGRAELAIIAPPLGLDAPGHGPEQAGHPTDAEMDLDVSRGAGGAATIAAFIGLCAIVGVVLFRQGRDRNPPAGQWGT